ncbi:MAG: cereblon family protein [Desulfovibrionaceae bacterium]
MDLVRHTSNAVPWPLHNLREDRGQAPTVPGQVRQSDLETLDDEHGGRILVCRACGRRITRTDARIRVNGLHHHVFCNPHGIVYELGCFAFAAGCLPSSPAVEDFSWFPGYSWQIVSCAGCADHLGWRYTSRTGQGFYGLILERLREEDES